MTTTLQNTPVLLNLLTLGNSRGWSISGEDAVHEVCNSGKIKLKNYPITAGSTYEFTYLVKSINNGYVQPELGGVLGPVKNTTGFVTISITAINSNPVAFYSNANATISIFNIRNSDNTITSTSKDSIVWAELINRWVSFRSISPDCGYSLFANLFTYKNGQLWLHSADNGRNSFYGQSFDSTIKFAGNASPLEPKTFEGLTYRANRLMITTTDGITTSLGQVSNLIAGDFEKARLIDGATEVIVYDVEGHYSAGFMKAMPDVVNGDPLKGNWIIIELTTVGQGVLRLSNITIHSERSAIGPR